MTSFHGKYKGYVIALLQKATPKKSMLQLNLKEEAWALVDHGQLFDAISNNLSGYGIYLALNYSE